MERRKVLFFQPILHDFPLYNGRLTHSLKVICDSLPKLFSWSYEFHLSKSNPINIRHIIPVKIVLYSNYPVRKSGSVYLSIKRWYINFYLSSNIGVTLMNTPMISFKVYMPRLFRVTHPPVISGGVEPTVSMVPLVMPQVTPLSLHSRVRWSCWLWFSLLKLISST